VPGVAVAEGEGLVVSVPGAVVTEGDGLVVSDVGDGACVSTEVGLPPGMLVPNGVGAAVVGVFGGGVGTNGIGGRVGVPGGTGERVGNNSPKF
jgi:hypothetical protein